MEESWLKILITQICIILESKHFFQNLKKLKETMIKQLLRNLYHCHNGWILIKMMELDLTF